MSTDIVFSTNPTVQTQVEGLAVAEVKKESRVTGANVNTVALFDTAVRGPLTPQVLGSPSDQDAIYGGRDLGDGGAIVSNLWKATLNRRFSFPLIVCRVAAAAAVAAAEEDAANVIRVTASSVGTWANGATTGVSFAITAASNGNANYFNLVVKYQGKSTTYRDLTVNGATADNLAQVIGTSATNLVVVTKLASGNPTVTTTDLFLTAGTDGTVAASDYQTALDSLCAYPGVSVIPVGCSAMPTHGAMTTYVQTKAAAFPMIRFLVWSGANNSRANEITAKTTVGGTFTKNVCWCYNASSTLETSTNALVETGPHLDMAVILGNTDVAVHPGDYANMQYLTGIKRLYNTSLSRADLALLRAAGISTMEPVEDDNGGVAGFAFRSAVSANSTGAVGESTSIEFADVGRQIWLVKSIVRSLRWDVKSVATASKSRSMLAKLTQFADTDQKQEHIVAPDDPDLGPGYLFQFVETAQERAANIRKLLCKIRLLPYNLVIVLMVDIATDTVIVKVQ